MFLLARATESIPIGTACAVWVGIGGGRHGHRRHRGVNGDSITAARVAFLAMLVSAIVGMKLTGA